MAADSGALSEAAWRDTALYTVRELPGAERLNPQIQTQFAACCDTDQVRRSHFLAGRYENLYLPLDSVPALAPVLEYARDIARELLGTSAALRTGFWFNRMGPGHVTLPHCHDENDELLSAAYYIDVPPASGDLILHATEGKLRITPQAGQLVLFAPSLVHEVACNRSGAERLSVGINIGPA